jgi:predicted TIM-barrel fold metal-dependent hydrolase
MDQCAISHAIVVAGGTVSPLELAENIALGKGLDVAIDNAGIKRATDQSGGRLLPFFFANPRRGTAEYRETGADFLGLKLGPAVHGVPLIDSRTLGLLDVAAEFKHPVYLHCLARAGFTVTDFAGVAAAHPKLTFILGHAGVGNADFHAIQLIRDIPNIYFETSGGFSAVVRTAIRELGAERVLFGTEYPLQHPAVEIAKFEHLGLSPDTFQAVTQTNIQRLLGRRTQHGAH